MILNFNPRSREGSDYMRSRLVIVTFDFNPRSREGSDVYHHAVDGYRSDFNPRSREGSDVTGVSAGTATIISIHAPVKGATC